eukprot:scaffold1129_cov376-Prasinococcus_capsulatus_cf.AAC.12
MGAAASANEGASSEDTFNYPPGIENSSVVDVKQPLLADSAVGVPYPEGAFDSTRPNETFLTKSKVFTKKASNFTAVVNLCKVPYGDPVHYSPVPC